MNRESTDPNGTRMLVAVWVGTLVVLAVVGFFVYGLRTTVTTVRGGDGAELSLAITRAEAVNMATAAFLQSRGRNSALLEWGAKATPQERYQLLAPFLAFAPADLQDYMPQYYRLGLPTQLNALRKVPLEEPDGVIVY